jgi:hypothetical protein
MPLATPYAYLVLLDLKTPNGNYTPLSNQLQASSRWWHFMPTVWIVKRYETLNELHNVLVPLIFKDDRLLILPAKRPAAGWLPPEAWTWINENMPAEW